MTGVEASLEVRTERRDDRLLIALADLALWVGTAANFDFSSGGLQEVTDAVWFESLGVSYKVGLYDFSLWLVGLTVVVAVAAMGYALWAGRERPRAYFGLQLFLLGAMVGVFSAQDLLLFYVFYEAMLIPLFVLLGVWGGARRGPKGEPAHCCRGAGVPGR